MTRLERLIRNLVTTTLPLSLIGCASGDRCDQRLAPPDGDIVVDITCRISSPTVFQVCGGPPLTDAGTAACGPPGFELYPCPDTFCQPLCNGLPCHVLATDGGMTEVACGYMDCTGRRPTGLLPASPRGRRVLGLYAARAAHLEAASVPAFERLRLELRRLGAPRALANEAGRAARDEQGHARDMTALAERHGGEVPTVEVVPARAERSLEEIAVENAVEGCTRELFGAAVAAWQADAAGDAGFRRAMRQIAADELRHAELGLAIAAWADSLLDDAARSRVAAARRTGLATLERNAAARAPADLIERAGLPTRSNSLRLLRSLA